MNEVVSQPINDSVPPELQLQSPREIALTPRGVFVIIATAAFLAGLLTMAVAGFVYSAYQRRNAADLKRAGRLINADEALITASRRAWWVNYTFTYDGKVYHGKAIIPDERFEDVRSSEHGSRPFPVLFLPGSPSINHPADWHETGSPELLPAIFVLLATWLFVAQSGEILKDRQLARFGKVAAGTVAGYRYAKNGTVRLKYDFRDSDDLPSEGRGYYPKIQRKGAQICVLYMPQNSERNRPYPLFFFRAAK